MAKRIIGEAIRKLHEIFKFIIGIVNDVIYDEYTRRAFANNAFDGALTLLGILMGNLVLNEFRPEIVIKIGLSTCLAIGMSGTFGRFLSERAERKRSLRQIEKDLLTDLSNTKLERESEKKIVIISLVDGLSPALVAVIPLAPFFLAQASLIPVSVSIIACFVLVFLSLFGLGMFLGKTCEENTILYGGLVLTVGFITSLIIFLASIYFQ